MTSQSTPQWRGQWLGWISLATLLFFNLLPSAYVQMVNFPHILVWQIGFLCLGIWGIWMLRQFDVPFQPLRYRLDWGIGFILIALILSVTFAEFKEVAVKNFSMVLGYGGLLYVLRNWLQYSKLTWEKIELGLCIIGSIVGIWSLVLWLPNADFQFLRNAQPLGHHNVLASYILLVFPIIISYTLIHQNWKRWLGFLIGAELLFTFYTTGSRGGLVGLFALILFSIGLLIFQTKGKTRTTLLLSSTLILILGLAFVFTNTRFENLIVLNGNAENAPLIEIQADGQTKDRFLMWQAGLNILQDRPFFGVGIGNMARVYNLYRPLAAGTGASIVQHLHSLPMQVLGEIGLFGFTAVAIFLGFVIRLWLRLYRNLSHQKERYLLFGIGGSFLAYLASVLTDYQLENIGISGTIVVLLVLLLNLADESNTISKKLSDSKSPQPPLVRGADQSPQPPLVRGADQSPQPPLVRGANQSPQPPLVRGADQSPQPPWLRGADQSPQPPLVRGADSGLSFPLRRGISLVSIAFLSLACFSSFPLTVAMGVHQRGESFLEQNEGTKAFNQINAASEIVPWDPTYSVQLGQRFLNLRESATGEDDLTQLSEIAVEYLQQGVNAAPNDQWFHHTLGLALLPIDAEKAKQEFRRVVELLPRGNFYDYYLLALSYLETNQPREKIITALALQGLVKPEFLTFPVWETNQQLAALKPAVLEQTLDYLQQLEARLNGDNKGYNQVYELQVLLRWWHDLPLAAIEMSRLRPIIQGLLVAETSREEALNVTQSALENKPDDTSLLLLRAWLEPDQYLESYLAESELFGEDENTKVVQDYLKRYDQVQSWLGSLQPQVTSSRNRAALIYTYRNYDVRFIGSIPAPPELTYYPIIRSLQVFADYPRELIPLEYWVHEVLMTEL